MSSAFKRWWWALLLVAVAAGFWRLRFDVEILDLLPPEEPTVQGLKLYQRHFTNARELIITLRAPDAERAERLAGMLASRLGQETNLVASVSWQPPWTGQPGQLAEILAALWFNQPPEQVRDLTNRLSPDRIGAVLADTREVLSTSLSPMDIARRAFDPFDLLNLPALTNFSGLSMEQGQKVFASGEGAYRLLFVQARPDLGGYEACARWLGGVRSRVDTLRAENPEWQGTVVRYTGRPAFVTEIAQGMQRDLSGSVAGTAVIIALLFWLTHRRWLPMAWLLVLLALILVATLALGGLVLGTISVLSMGFAAVLLGLAVDYAVVHYQEALSHPRLSVPEIRQEIAPSILWAATTTICAFLVLNLGGLPGLAQLGTLVAIGVALAAWVMVMVYLPPLFPARRKAGTNFVSRPWWAYFMPPRQGVACGSQASSMDLENRSPGCPDPTASDRRPSRGALYVTAGLVLGTILLLSWMRPGLDRTGNALRPQRSEAEAALQEMTAEMGIPQEALWLIVAGRQESDVYQRLIEAQTVIEEAKAKQFVTGCLLPVALWPHPEYQVANRAAASWLGQQGPRLRDEALRGGFTTNALMLTEELAGFWARAGASSGVVWPTNEVSQWLLKRFVAHDDGAWYVMGLVYPATNAAATTALAELSRRLGRDGVFLSGWGLLGTTTLQRVRDRMWAVMAPMVILVLLSLWSAFRRSTEVWLGLGVLLLSGLCLLAIMALAGWSWNLLNLMALPLMLGTGVDYSIFMQLALRRHHGDLVGVRRSIGRALLLCGGTAVAGFGSLAWAGNAGLASLGQVCAVGIGANMLIAVFLLPAWWHWVSHRPRGAMAEPPGAPSSFYRAWLWRLGLGLVRFLPQWALKRICLAVAEVYYRLHRERRALTVRNLLPVFQGNRVEAERAAHGLFLQFAVKMGDLWRFESGETLDSWFTAGIDWTILEQACARGKGVLLLTPHLGNWEIGGALLARRGIRLVVLTQAEPGEGLTELRKAARAKWGIETIVIGSGGFEFVEIIKRLQAGENVALLVDRPPAAKAVTVELFGRPFRASIAAAELARASGCALLGVVVVRMGQGYAARVLPEFVYNRQALGSREARHALTQQILRAFEPEIRQSPDQWFHFVPIWPEDGSAPT